MWKKIFLTLLLLLTGLALYLLWTILSPLVREPKEVIITPSPPAPTSHTTSQQDAQTTQNSSEEDSGDFAPARAYHVTQKDCKEKCTSFDKNSDGWTYCANVCGIIPTGVGTTDCAENTGLTQDYCLRDAAINAIDVALCAEITDRAIAKQCRDRIAEKIIDEQF